MEIVLSGSSGFIGSWLRPELESRGHRVIRLVRDPALAGSDGCIFWDPAQGQLEPTSLQGADAVVNLAGRNISGARWSTTEKRRLTASRLQTTETLVRAMTRCSSAPAVLVNASAVGYYGSREDEELNESSGAGDGFLARLARTWEGAALEAVSAGVRVVLLRLGMVVGRGGALGRMLPAFRLGLGGRLGSGRQWWPWIAMEDVLGAVVHVLEDSTVSGAVNLVSPCAVSCRQFVQTLGAVLGRPAFLPVPAAALRLLMGEMAQELLLSSVRAVPQALQATGYEFRLPDLAAALRAAMD